MKFKTEKAFYKKIVLAKSMSIFALFLIFLQTLNPFVTYAFLEKPKVNEMLVQYFPKVAAHVETLGNVFFWQNEEGILQSEDNGLKTTGASLVLKSFSTSSEVSLESSSSQGSLLENKTEESKEGLETEPEILLDAGGLDESDDTPFVEIPTSTQISEPTLEENLSSSTVFEIETENINASTEPSIQEEAALPESILDSLNKLAEEPKGESEEGGLIISTTSDSSFLEAWDFESLENEQPDKSFFSNVSLNFSLSLNSTSSGSLLFYVQTQKQDWTQVFSLDLSQVSVLETSQSLFADLPNEIFESLNSAKIRVAYAPVEGSMEAPSLSLESLFLQARFLIPTSDSLETDEKEEVQVLDPEGFLKMNLINDAMEVSMPGDLKNPITLGLRQEKKVPDLKMFLTSQNASTTAVREGDVIKYLNVYNSVDVEYEINKKGFKENIVLKDKEHPESFSYSVNLNEFDISFVSDSLLKLYQKGFKDNPLKLLYTISAPYMEDAARQRSEQVLLQKKGNNLVVIPSKEWLSKAVYPVKVDPSVEINVLNVHSHPAEGEFWDVDFTTLGAADLTITPADEATINDDEFVSLFCGSEDRTPEIQVLTGDIIYYPNWSCDEVSTLRHKTLYAGSHHLLFKFGDAESEAFNAAYTWDGGGGDANWTTAANWSSDIVPTSGDTVTINNSCASNCNPVINTSTTVSGITISSATTTVTVQNGFTFSVGNNGFTISNGTFNGGAATTSIGGTFTISGGTYNAATTTVLSGSSYTININSSQTFYNLNISGTGGTTKTISSGDVLVVMNDLILTDGLINLSSYASPGFLDARGNISQASTFDGGSAIVDFGNDSLSQTWTASGGSGPAVRFNSASDASDSIVINAATTIFGATTTPAFVGTIPISNPSNFDLTFGGSTAIPAWAQAAGTFNGGSGTTTISSGDFIITGGIFNAATTTVFTGLSSDIDVNSTLALNNLTFNSSSFNTKTISTGDTLIVSGNLYLTRGNIAGGNIQTMGNIVQASTMEGSSSIVDFSNDSLSQTWTLNGGTGPIIRLDNAADALDSVVMSAAGGFYGATITPSFSGDIPISNPSGFNLTFSTGGYEQAAGTFNGWNGTTTISGDLIIIGGNYNASTNTALTGLSSGLDFNTSQEFYNFYFNQNNISGKIIGTGDTLVVLNNLFFNDGQVNSSGLIEARGNVTVSNNFDGANTALKFTGSSTSGSVIQTFNVGSVGYLYDGDITVDKPEGEVVLVSNLLTNTTNQDITVNSGILNLNGFALSATGTNSSIVVQGAGTLKLIGTENVMATGTNPSLAATSTVLYYGTTSSYTLKSFTYGNLTIAGNGGTFAPSGTTLSVMGDLNLNAGTFNASSIINLYGNFSRTSGSFNPNSGTVNLLGANQAIYGSSTFYNLSKSTTTSYTLTFASSTTQTVTNSLTLQGGAGQQLLLRSDVAGTQWKIDPQSTRNISFVDVKDSNNINLSSIAASGTGSTNSGNNINWDFGTSYAQNQYRFYENLDDLQPSVALAALNSTTTLGSTSSPIRLRMNVTVSTADLGTSSQAFLLQFATSTSGSWNNVGSGQAWEFYNNPSVANTTTIFSVLLSDSDVGSLYMEANPTDLNPNSVSIGQDMEFDFPIKPTYAATTTYFFRLIRSDTANLSSYSNYPAVVISMNSAPSAPSSLGPASFVNGSWVSSTTPTFTFSLTDPDISDTVRFLFQLSTSSTFSNLSVSYLSALGSFGSKSFRVGQPTGTGTYLTGSPSQSLVQANYFWRVFAIDNLGATSSTSTANGGAIAFRQDSTGPTVGTLSVATTSTTSLTASISGASDSGSGLASFPYTFYNSIAGTNSSATSSTSWLSSSLTPNTQYSFYADVTDFNGNSSSSTSVQIYTLAQPPSALVLTVNSATQITASWSTGSNPVGTLYAVTNESTGDVSTWSSANTSIFSSLTCETSYTFSVKAKNGDGYITSSSSSVSAQTSTCSVSGGGSGGSGGGGGGGLPTPPVSETSPSEAVPPVVVVVPVPPKVTPPPYTTVAPILPVVVAPPIKKPESAPSTSTPHILPEVPSMQEKPKASILPHINWPVIKLPKIPEIKVPDISFKLPDFKKPLEELTDRTSEVFVSASGSVRKMGDNILSASISGLRKSQKNIQLIFANSKQLAVNSISKIQKPKSVNKSFLVLAVAPSFLAAEYSIAAQGLKLAASSWFELWLSFLSLFQGLLTSLGLRKRRRMWGTVYDSKNKQPLDPALVQLIDAKTGKVVQESITDLYGKFGFLDKPGDYFITASKTHYSFPAKNVSGTSDGVFADLYFGSKVSLVKGQELLVPNIPMDPLEYDWNQQEKSKMLKFSPRLEYAVTLLLQTFFWVGLAVTILLAIKETTLFNLSVVGVYLLMTFLRKFIPHRHLWGRIYSESVNVEGLLLELYHPQIPSVVLSRGLASTDGKFFLKAKPGEYMCRVKQIEGETVKILVNIQVKIGVDGVVNDEIRI